MRTRTTLQVDTRGEVATRHVAALPMYDMPQLRQATDEFWHAISVRLQAAGLKAPASLARTDDYLDLVRNPDLLLGQACGYPLVVQFKNAVEIVATPIYSSRGCEGFDHCSVFIVNAEAGHRTLRDLRGSTCAINGYDSNTGMNLLRAAIAPIANGQLFFRSVTVTGAHRHSLEAVANGQADIAAIDCISFAHFQRFEPELTARVSTIGQSLRTPAPPFITAQKDAGIIRILRDVLHDVATAPELASVRADLNIAGISFEPDIDYRALLTIERSAAELGYPELR